MGMGVETWVLEKELSTAQWATWLGRSYELLLVDFVRACFLLPSVYRINAIYRIQCG